jgi:TonB family protein
MVAQFDVRTNSADAPAMGRATRWRPTVLLVTPDEAMWFAFGAALGADWILKRTDTIAGAAAMIDPRSYVIAVLDGAAIPSVDAALAELRPLARAITAVRLNAESQGHRLSIADQVSCSALIGRPLDATQIVTALEQARLALEKAVDLEAPDRERGPRRSTLLALTGAITALALVVVLYLQQRGNQEPPQPTAAGESAQPADELQRLRSAAPNGASIEAQALRRATLLDNARAAMAERRYVTPADANALGFYRDLLALDPNDGEAREGLTRLSEVLLDRAEASFAQRTYDAGLQALETARELNPSNARLPQLDLQLASIRAQLGVAPIQAAIEAQSFERASQLIEQATRANTLTRAQLETLRTALGRAQAGAELERLLRLARARTQQGRLLDPDDGAIALLTRARAVRGAPNDSLLAARLETAQTELRQRLAQEARAALEDDRTADASRLLQALRAFGGDPATMAALQRDLDAKRSRPTPSSDDESRLARLVQDRIGAGALTQSPSALDAYRELRSRFPRGAASARAAAMLEDSVARATQDALRSNRIAQALELIAAARVAGISSAALDAFERDLSLANQLSATDAPISAAKLAMTRPLRVQYPRRAAARNVPGTVDLSFVIDREGVPREISIIRSDPPELFDSAAIEALEKTRYAPIIRDGAAIEQRAQIRLRFAVES